jgi:hypothetical protein
MCPWQRCYKLKRNRIKTPHNAISTAYEYIQLSYSDAFGTVSTQLNPFVQQTAIVELA